MNSDQVEFPAMRNLANYVMQFAPAKHSVAVNFAPVMTLVNSAPAMHSAALVVAPVMESGPASLGPVTMNSGPASLAPARSLASSGPVMLLAPVMLPEP